MKLLSNSFTVVVVSALVAFAGCTKKPQRPTPDQTVLGQQGANGGSLNPTDAGIAPTDANSALTQRDGVIETADQIRGLLQPVYFDFDKSSIKQEERAKLQAAKEYLEKNPQYRLLLEGHCDWKGTAEYNLGLGDRRANASKKYLETLGVTTAKLETLSKGSLEAKDKGSDEERAKDRRVDLVVLKK